jgi:mono/diheme cytochrome c family protein
VRVATKKRRMTQRLTLPTTFFDFFLELSQWFAVNYLAMDVPFPPFHDCFRSPPYRMNDIKFPNVGSIVYYSLLVIAIGFGLCSPTVAQENLTPEQTEIYELQGEYLKGDQGVQVAALGADEFVVSLFAGGLPGAGWNRSEPQITEMSRDDLSDFIADSGAKKVVRTSSTLGLAAPTSAVVLFDGTEESLKKNWDEKAKLVEGKLLAGGTTTQQKFQSYRLHLEFKTPFMPNARGQGRGNSGVYHQGCFETQVLDSFGLPNLQDTCGAIYSVRAADFNASLPPLTWQTYDVEFTAPSWDAAGKKTKDAQLSVWLNGFLIHRDQAVPGPTRAAPNTESPTGGPLYLQDHGNPVAYRNIWLVPFDAAQNAYRPRIPAFERFATVVSSAEERAEAGRWLVGELGCQACHQIATLTDIVQPKEAPVLTQVTQRIQSKYYETLLSSPHLAKVGTTMPDVMHGLSDEERLQKAKAIAAFLQSTGRTRQRAHINLDAVKRGEELYNKIGCTICHGQYETSTVSSTSVPLPKLSDKYILEGLIQFLNNPHAVRPSDRMPTMHLSNEESRDIAHYLLKDLKHDASHDTTKFEVYHGSWDKLPDFSTLKPVTTGTCDGFDLAVAQRGNNFAVRFESYFVIDTPGKYRLYLGSDDGSQVYVDDKKIVDVDGIHPHQTSSGEVELSQGAHKLRVDYFQGGGEWTVACEIEGPNISRQPIESWLQLEATTPKTAEEATSPPELIAEGKATFAKIGCVKCHKLEGLSLPQDAALAPSLSAENLNGGCLAEKPSGQAMNYHLSENQRQAIRDAISQNTAKPLSPQAASRQIMATLNCYACHARDNVGGPEADRLAWFTSTIPEMGEEGRLPPLLTGVGDKLTDDYLNHVVRNGDRLRPYMNVRMPKFNTAATALAAHWITTDRQPASLVASKPESEEAEFRTLATGRQLAGVKGLACVQCHTFGNQRAIGIQAINLLSMPQRLRQDWFLRYMLHPTRYRPGTRMPASFPDGKSVLTTVYDGDANRQIEALWKFLSAGEKGGIPDGLQRDQIVLEPQDKPIIYRNFLEGLSARGIAVGYPGGLNIAWDAETMRVAQIWHGQFIDASMHWRDRGVGRQRPLGDHLLFLEPASAVALLDKPDSVWPKASNKQEGYQFKGYRLLNGGKPTFRYLLDDIEILDTPDVKLIPKTDPALVRTWTISTEAASTQTVYLRLAIGDHIQSLKPGVWKVDNRFEIELNLTNLPPPVVRTSEGKQELLIAIENLGKAPKSVQCEIRW